MANSKAFNNKGVGVAFDEVGDVVNKTKVIRLIASGVGTTEAPLTFTLPARSIVTAVYLNVITAEATGTTKTLDIGTATADSGDPDGFLDGISVAATGVIRGTLLSSGQTLGALLRADESGAGVLVPEPYVNAAAKRVSVTAASANFAELVADLIIEYKEITD